MGTVVGLDLSLRASGVCALPTPWNQDMRLARVMHVGAELTKEATATMRIERMVRIANTIVAFCRSVNAGRVFIEDHAFGLSSTNNANQTIEMTGIVKAAIYTEIGSAVEPVHASRARKILLQQLPRKDIKKFAQANVKRLGGVVQSWSEDEIDSFVIANAGIMLTGGVAMTFPGT